MRDTLPARLALALLLALAAACGGGDPATPECTTHEACPAKQYCDEAGACAPLAAGACRKVADCDLPPGAGGVQCVEDACVFLQHCTRHEDCPAGEACGAGQVCEALPDGVCHKVADCAGGYTCFESACTSECSLAANVARRAELLAAQPALAVAASSGKLVRTFTKAFTSVTNPAIVCPVSLQYRDLSGDGALQPYEDWTLTPAERAADLAVRLGAGGRRALLAHPALSDVPATGATGLSAATAALVDAGVRFGLTSAATASVSPRATWANTLQAHAEASPLGVPFVLSMEPAHTTGPGRVHAKGFAYLPAEAAYGAGGDAARVEAFGRIVSQEYRAIGVRMALAPSANLATDPRWPGAQWTFGEDSATVSAMAGAFVKGAQGDALGKESVAVVLGEFPGAGAAKGGLDARLAKGKYTSYPGGRFEDHARAFDGARAAGVAGVSTGRAIPEAGAWTAFGGVVNGASLEQVGATFNGTIVSGLLRGHLGHGGLVVAPAGVLEEPGLAPLGTPWGVEGLTKAQRIAKAVGAGVDQFVGLDDLGALAAAGLDDARVTVSATRLLTLAFRLGLFEDPYVDAAAAPTLCNTDAAHEAGLTAMNGGMVLLRNVQKPAGFLNGNGDGTQLNDPFNAGNGTMKVLPAPPGNPYLIIPNHAFFAGDFDLMYVSSVSAGYTSPMNGSLRCGWSSDVVISTDAERMACSDYVFVRIAAPASPDPDSGSLALPLPSLTYAGNDAAVLAPVAAARAAIDAWAGPPASRAQLVVVVDAGRPSVVAELLSGAYGVSALYVDWSGTMTSHPYGDKIALDVMFGIVNGTGKLPFALPASDEAAAAQLPDVPGDGADTTFVRGYGLTTSAFQGR